MRLFTAVTLPDAISTHLDGALGGIGGSLVADPGAGLRWVPRRQRHLTLAFHGNVPDGLVPGYLDALPQTIVEAGVEPFSLALAGGGSFSSKTLWAGVGPGEKELKKLAGIVSEAAAEAGLWPDEHAGGRPHVTLARSSSNRGEAHRRSGRRNQRRGRGDSSGSGSGDEAPIANLEAWARALAIYRGPVWTVDTIKVFRSELGKGPGSGPLHTEIAAVPLVTELPDVWDDLVDPDFYGTSAGSRLKYRLNFDLIEAQ